MLQTLTEKFRTMRSWMTERGASAVEYGLLIAGIAAVIVVAVMALGPVVTSAFDDTCEKIEGNVSASCDTAETPPSK